jgi:ankyrin repeat protein
MEPTFVSILHLLAYNGYEDEAYTGSAVCKETWEDKRIFFPRLINKKFGRGKHTLIEINAMCSNETLGLQRIKTLVSYGANPDIQNDSDQFTPLLHLCLHGDTYKMDTFKYLLSQNVRLNGYPRHHWCPLSLLATRSSARAKMELLLDHGADIHTTHTLGHSVLYTVCRSSDVENADIIHFLCDRGARVNGNEGGLLPLSGALQKNVEFAEALVQRGSIIPEDSMEDALGLRLEPAVQFLQKHGFRIPEDALMEAIEDNDPGMVHLLLSCRVSPNTPIFGKPPLFHAVSYITKQTVVIVRILCYMGANVNARSLVTQFTPFTWVYETKEEPVLYDMIRQYIRSKNPHILDIIQILVEHGAIPPPSTEYSHIPPFNKNPLSFGSMNAILLRGRGGLFTTQVKYVYS